MTLKIEYSVNYNFLLDIYSKVIVRYHLINKSSAKMVSKLIIQNWKR